MTIDKKKIQGEYKSIENNYEAMKTAPKTKLHPPPSNYNPSQRVW